MEQIYLTKHAKDKIILLAEYRFNLQEEDIISAIKNPDKVFFRENQKKLLKIYNEDYAMQVVCEEEENKIKIITIFPVRRRRYGI